ncbi:conserved hypothetical protein [Candidatus Desulfarcum epimagneticum]|uniref:DUF2304 domain-containing protein n=1 Tax=uncultured Desulfobacteraceae bacterium TaxID=218296 RepID=A0A484HIG7_9BACT|nr:conserved hypothetical protein [uncultured Desulfobacteraceae bacterium]
MTYDPWVFALIGLALALAILFLIRRDLIHPHYAIWWLLAAGAIALFSFFPRLIDFMENRMGIARPLSLTALGLMAVKMLEMDLDRSRLERRVRRLTQRLAILEDDISDPGARKKETPKRLQ